MRTDIDPTRDIKKLADAYDKLLLRKAEVTSEVQFSREIEHSTQYSTIHLNHDSIICGERSEVEQEKE
ncbi:hypothetical protein RRG08_009741 [Elysia crispata]|uniref:Uncharacterized protein n=1 Tax=Elysia crispata TaxID=231223 RepID=A0AAE1D6T8_9GAST|nr:hypothetical protein RRG08_009741 [Elysia crispata]